MIAGYAEAATNFGTTAVAADAPPRRRSTDKK
jgi:hypothetical protein